MLFSYNADLLPRLRMTGHIRYSQPWIHFARRLDEYVPVSYTHLTLPTIA